MQQTNNSTAWLSLGVLLLIFSLPLAGQVSPVPDSSVPNRILILHDSSDLGMWRDQFDLALRDFVSENTTPDFPVRVSVIYTGLNVYGEEPPTALVEYLEEQHALDPVSLVIAVLPNSAEFMNRIGNDIYAEVAKIFVAPGDDQLDNLTVTESELVITSEDASAVVEETLRISGQLLPDLTDLFVFSGVDNYGPTQRQQVEALADELVPGVDVHYITGLPIGEIANAINPIPPQSAGFLLSYEIDTEGNMFTTTDVLNELVNNTDLPLFGSFDSLHGRGVIGGYMDSATARGAETGRVALNLLAGRSDTDSLITTQYLFDGRQLNRFNIDRSTLPPGSIIEFDVFSVWDNYRSEILGAIFLLLLQSLLITALVLSLKRRRAAELSLERHIEELAVQKNLFESVINSFPDAILITHADRTIYAANLSTTEVFGFGPDQLVGKTTTELIEFRSDDERLSEQAMLDAHESDLKPLVLQFRHRNGSTFSGETIGTKIRSSSGEVLGYFSMVRDVTKRLKEQEQLQQSQKMEALGTMVGGIAHDFNNVLGVISAYAEVNALTEESPQGKSNLDKIVQATQRGADLCKQILSFSRNTGVDQHALDLSEIVEETTTLLKATLSNSVELLVQKNSGDFRIKANATQIQQVILNLATNASLAIENGDGKIEVALFSKQFDEAVAMSQGVVEAGSYVCIRVSDNGCGIAAEEMSRIFEPFYTSREGEGNGMGLAIVYKIVQSHSGIINLQSVEGMGTSFEIYFPLYTGNGNGRPESKSQELMQGNGQKILLVDDEEELLESLRELLSNIGYHVEAFADSTVALSRFREQPDTFDLLISDQVMPHISGTGLAESIRELRKDMPVIICTGHSELLDDRENLNITIDAILRKPFTASEISRNIGSLLATQH